MNAPPSQSGEYYVPRNPFETRCVGGRIGMVALLDDGVEDLAAGGLGQGGQLAQGGAGVLGVAGLRRVTGWRTGVPINTMIDNLLFFTKKTCKEL